MVNTALLASADGKAMRSAMYWARPLVHLAQYPVTAKDAASQEVVENRVSVESVLHPPQTPEGLGG